ncbi:hypothetical protein VDGD_00848 [Verticillium dahliae]|nr:hypothetical protein VDGD_00848 [Verticillium dahliae]
MPIKSHKRKRPHNDSEAIDPPAVTAPPPPTTEATTRRATRQTPILPPVPPPHASPPRPATIPALADAEPPVQTKRGRGRPPKPKTTTDTPVPVPTNPGVETVTRAVPPSAPSTQPGPTQQQTTQAPRVTRQRGASMVAINHQPPLAIKEAKENVRPANGLVAPQITYQAPQPQSQPWTRTLMRPSPPTSLPPSLQPQPSVQDNKRHLAQVGDPAPYQYQTRPTNTPIPVPAITHSSPRTPSALPQHPTKQEAQKKTAMPTPRTDRNIDKVVLGDICFRTWYPSYYGKELLGDISSGHASSKPSHAQHANGSKDGHGQHSSGEAGAKAHARRGGDAPMLDRLYVCPCCFKYSKELVSWLGHVHVCERSAGTPPGRKIYVHPRGRRTVLRAVPEVKRGPGKKANAGIRHVEEVVRDQGEWSVWEVDGEVDGLFCQNLSLFAKLFLDNKSVFFDVTGFTYFLLVYTPPAPPPTGPPDDPSQPAVDTSDEKPVRPHIVGFFSKEKMSWDNNNLACILVFPPWQRKGLGALLMGVSYEISRREGVLGGPEKPISDLGRKGYRRFWGGEIARWLLGIGGIAGALDSSEETLVDVGDCSRGTWIALDDCLATLREMGLLQDAGVGPGKKPEVSRAAAGDDGDEAMEDVGDVGEPEPVPDVPRVRLDKEAVRGWIAANGISLERVCDPHGFVEGYAMKQGSPEEEEYA